ncbi:PE family protein, partial [Mycobacterium ulcerans]
MSYVFASPEVLNAAAAEVSTIGSSLQTANAWAAAPTTALLSALGADEVSAVVTAMFGNHAQAYPAVSTQAAEFHDRSVAALSAGADAYSGAEASSAATLQ